MATNRTFTMIKPDATSGNNIGGITKMIEEAGVSWRSAEVLVNEKEHESGKNTKARDTDLIMLPHHESDGSDILSQFTKRFHENLN
jgi:nucleoside diphosphate kinase